MSEEVKVQIRTEADLRGAVDAKAKIVELREEAARLRQSAEVYSQKYGFDDSRARSARSEASTREREANRLERPINIEQKTAHKEERDEKAKSIREHRAAQRAAAAEERADIRDVAREHRQAETQRQRFGRLMFGQASGIGGGGIIGGAAMFGIGETMNYFMEKQGIALRDQAARTMNARGLAVTQARGTSGQAQAEQYATEQRMDDREANRAAFDQEQNKKTVQHGLAGVGAGAGLGFMVAGPLGALVGGLIAGIGGMIHGGLEGSNAKAERDAAQKRDAKLREDQVALTRKMFNEGDGKAEMDLAQHRSQRSMSGQRAAFIDEQKLAWIARYRGMRDKGAPHENASETAGLEAETRMRDRQIAGGSALVDARSGAGDIAAAARWGGASTPGMLESKAALEVLQRMEKTNYDALEKQRHQDHSVEAQDKRR